MRLLLLILAGLLHVSSGFLGATPRRLPLSAGDFVEVLAGSPGVYLKLQVNLTSDVVELYSPLAQRSRTAVENGDSSGSDYFYFDADTRLHLAYRLNFIPEKDNFEFYSRGDGSLGLGRYSPLSKFWQNYTYVSHYLYLGGYDAYSQLDYHERGPVLRTDSDSFACRLLYDSGAPARQCRAKLDPTHMDTYLPNAIYEQRPSHIVLLGEHCELAYRALGIPSGERDCSNEETFELSGTALQKVNGAKRNATQRYDGEVIQLGLHFLEGFSLYHDNVAQREFFVRSAFSIPPSVYTAVCIVLMAFILMSWITIVVVDNYASEWTLNLTFMLEFYGYLVCFVAWCNAVLGMHWSRLVANFLRTTGSPLVYAVAVAMLLCLVGSLWVMRHFELQITLRPRPGRMDRNRAAARRFKYVRLLLFPTTVLTSLWLCALQSHNAFSDIVYLLPFVSAICINATVLAANVYVYSLPYAPLFYAALGPLYLFMWFTLVPTFNVIDLHYSTLVEAVNFTTYVVVLPSLMLFVKHSLASAESRVQTVKEKT
jgi:hypothetical protein